VAAAVSATELCSEVTGTVVRGDQRGRRIGFPTANLIPPPGVATPPPGVYAATVRGRAAAVNVGVRPTFADATTGTVIEVHILDFSGDLYGQKLTVRFLERLRDEHRFDDLEALLEQLRCDLIAVRAIAVHQSS
jgi:riboflavin kinase / FMN adenylyltransferase